MPNMIRNIPGLRKKFSGVPNLDPVIQIIEEFEKQIKVLKVLAHRTDSGKETLVNFMLELSGNFSSLLKRIETKKST